MLRFGQFLIARFDLRGQIVQKRLCPLNRSRSGVQRLLRGDGQRVALLDRLIQIGAKLLDLPVGPSIVLAVVQIQQEALIVALGLLQFLLRLLQLFAVAALQREEHVAGADVLPELDIDRGNLAGLVDDDVIVLAGGDRSADAHLGVDGVRLHIARRDLGKRPVQDGVGKEREHQHHREENDRGVFDPLSFFRFLFVHFDYPFTLP